MQQHYTHARYSNRPHMNLQAHMKEFLNGLEEICSQFSRTCRDIVLESLGRRERYNRNVDRDSSSYKARGIVCKGFLMKVGLLNQFSLGRKHPWHLLALSCLMFSLVFIGLNPDCRFAISNNFSKKPVTLYPGIDKILLPDGRHLAYREQGVSANAARFSVVVPHCFLSSRLAGIPGLKASLLEEYGVRLITYDLPGFGDSDPHSKRSLKSSASDMSHLASSLGVDGKFWLVGYSTGSLHVWAALKYIPNNIAGVAIISPFVNPYDPLLNKRERRDAWMKLTRRKKVMYFLARRFPGFLSFFYRSSFLSRKHSPIDTWLSISPGRRDKALLEDPVHEEFWQRDIEESTKQRNVKPFIQEAALQVSDWGFNLADLKLQKKKQGKTFLSWLIVILCGTKEQYTGYLGPIHMWQGMDDNVVPSSMIDFLHRMLPNAAVHKLPHQGHFTYFYFCDECHRQIFSTLFGVPQGPLNISDAAHG